MKVRPPQISTIALTAGSASACLTPSRMPSRTAAESALTGGELMRQHGDVALAGEIGDGIDGGHRRLLFSLPVCFALNKLERKIHHMQQEGMAVSLFDFSGKVALVTGSSSGIGQAIVERMAEHGAKVVVS